MTLVLLKTVDHKQADNAVSICLRIGMFFYLQRPNGVYLFHV